MAEFETPECAAALSERPIAASASIIGRRARIWLAAAILGILVLFGATYLLATVLWVPRLEVLSGELLHLSTEGSDGIAKGKILLRNTGNRPLAFSLSGSCGCGLLEPSSGAISPGCTQPIVIGVRLRHPGDSRSADTLIESNDPFNKRLVLPVLAEWRAPLRISPMSVDFDSVMLGHSVQTTLSLSDIDGKPLPPSIPLHIEVSSPFLQTMLSQNSVGERVLCVSLSGATPRGRFAGAVKVSRHDKRFSMTVPVCADVRGLLSVAPPCIDAQVSSDGMTPRLFIVTRNDKNPLAAPTHVEVPYGLKVDEVCCPHSWRRVFRVCSLRSRLPRVPAIIEMDFPEVGEIVRVEVCSPL